MRKPSLSFETFVAALAVVGAGTSMGCSKAQRVSGEPPAAVSPGAIAPGTSVETVVPRQPPATPAPPSQGPLDPSAATSGVIATPTSATPAAVAAPAPNAAAAAPAATVTAAADKPTKGSANPKTSTPKPIGGIRSADPTKGGSASCGAGSCSADMKKGNGN